MKVEIEVGIPVPNGYRAVGYRLAKKGECVLRTEGPAIASMDYSQPWIVLEQVELKDINEVRGASLKKLEQSCINLGNRLSATEEAHSLHMDEIAKRLEIVEQEVSKMQALEKVQERQPEPKKPQPYGLWDIKGEHWHTASPFESAGDASRYAHKSFYRDWRNQWRVYPYPEDGGIPVELREKPEPEEKWGLWGTNGETALVPELHWYGPDDANYLADSKDAVLKIKEECISIGEWNPYPYPVDGGMPMELREGGKQPTSEQLWEYLIRNGWRPRLGGYWAHPNGRVAFGKSGCDIGDYIDEIAKVEGNDADQVRAEMLTVSFEPPSGTIARDFHGQPFKAKQIDRPTVYYVRNKTTGNFLRRMEQKDRNTLFVTEDQALAEHMAQGTEGGPYEVYPVTLGE